MEYMTPSIYQKIIKTLSYIYSKSAVDEKIDLFRFKDVLDSYSEGQYKSKLWAVKELEKHITYMRERAVANLTYADAIVEIHRYQGQISILDQLLKLKANVINDGNKK